ncbi:MAG: hypothetical protein KTR25_15620 [Myxococcales bacterium]|nr:hypothetical protein [Myxococcales bacterium]
MSSRWIIFWLTLLGRVTQCWGYDASWRWHSTIAEFKDEDKQTPPPQSPVVFVGSSTIRYWTTLAEDMASLVTIRRGFGGAHLDDVVHYAQDIILDYHPKAVVVYAGDNDIHAGKTPERVYRDWRRLVQRVRVGGLDIPIFFISIKPSPQRWAEWTTSQMANKLVRDSCRRDDKLIYIDVASRMLTEKPPPKKWFAPDGLHLSSNGYALWVDTVKGVLKGHPCCNRP